MVRLGLGALVWALACCVAPWGHVEAQQTVESLLGPATRLVVLSPHPDDEVLGTGGLIQRVLRLGGRVKVVFLTNGDGFPEGVEREDHITHPRAEDYRRYGEERRQEALDALAVLGVGAHDAIFLGFPDGGLCQLAGKYRQDPQIYQSPYTLERHPPPSEMILPNTNYNGLGLIRELARILTDFRPTVLAVTRAQDEHPDHCTAFHFAMRALADLSKQQGRFVRPQILTFLIHFGQWPVGQGSGTGSRLNPPDGFPDATAVWLSFPLVPSEVEAKRKAILRYHTQMLVMGRFLMSFARANELFVSESEKTAREWEKMPCCRK